MAKAAKGKEKAENRVLLARQQSELAIQTIARNLRRRHHGARRRGCQAQG